MKKLLFLITMASLISILPQETVKETKEEHDKRMEWWRDARFGLFIHWGIYSVPAGEWNGNTGYAEWIRTQAEIPLNVYDEFVSQFNPVKFNAEEWVKIAKDAGMKYIVITSKHHDGFCIFNSEYTDYDIMSTPFKRDILKDLSEACKKEGIKLCFYYSIMDWHHPDYLPRRDWENRSAEGADYENYMQYMKNQLKELLTNYGEIGVLWFDGEWESTWSMERGAELYNYVRSLQPDIIVNNRVDPHRGGLEGFSPEGIVIGDFGTPEQQIPATGLPGLDWESCMTMNDHWGFNKNDNNWKSVKDIIQMLADIASKGGNYLLNVGPTSKGVFPPASSEILEEIGDWIDIYGESIYGTNASPFKNLEWGRCTQKSIGNDTRLYLHVFNWPDGGKLIVPGIYSEPIGAFLISDKEKLRLLVERNEDALIISVPAEAPDKMNSVVVLEVSGKADVNNPPLIISNEKIFIDKLNVGLTTDREGVEIHYTTDGTIPSVESNLYDNEIILTETTNLTARCFRNGKPVSGSVTGTFAKVKPAEGIDIDNAEKGIQYKYYEGKWDSIPDFNRLKSLDEGISKTISLEKKKTDNYFGFEFTGFIKIPKDGVYTFYTSSDDGSALYIGDKKVIDNDGLHGIIEKNIVLALKEGYHPFKVQFFEHSGGEDVKVFIKGEDDKKKSTVDDLLYYEK